MRRVRPVKVIRRIIRTKHGFVLMVVDHHPTDDTVHSGAHHLLGVCMEMLLLGHYCTAGCVRKVFKRVMRGREIWDRGQVASEVPRGWSGALLGGQLLRLLSLLWVVRIEPPWLVLFSPSRCWYVVATELLRVALQVKVIIPASFTLEALGCLCATGATQRPLPSHRSAHLCRDLLVKSNRCRDGLPRRVAFAMWVLLVELAILSQTWLQVSLRLGAVQVLLSTGLVCSKSCVKSLPNRCLACAAGEWGRHGLVHDLILSRGASAFIPHWCPFLVICPSYWTEVVSSLC